MMKTIVLGVGNPILQDDGVGLHVIEALRERLTNPKVTLETAMTGGMNLLDLIRGYEKVILIDAVKQLGSHPGEVKRFKLTDLPTVHSCNPHDVSLSEALQLAEQLKEPQLPSSIILIGITVDNTYEFGEHLSSTVASAVPKAVNLVLEELKNT
ncbi:MAG: Hydrogenase maturation protease [Thermoplasmatales archaeon]|jgi:hydrogenase maturation protease|nr:Hydrogenase maturation protease [Thermoplasmatales archaeon]